MTSRDPVRPGIEAEGTFNRWTASTWSSTRRTQGHCLRDAEPAPSSTREH